MRLLCSAEVDKRLMGSITATDKCGLGKNCKQLFMYMINWDKGVALAIHPCIFGISEYSISAGAPLPDLYFLMYFSLQQEQLHILRGINMQGNIAGAPPTSRWSYTM